MQENDNSVPPIPANPGACVDEAIAPESIPPVKKVGEQLNVNVSMATPVDILIHHTKNEKPDTLLQSPRNMWVIIDRITGAIPETDAADYEVTIKTHGTSPTGERVEIVMAQGPAIMVIKSIMEQLVPAPAAMSELFMTVRDWLERTPLRGIMVTALFDQNKPASFAVINHTLGDELKPEDINMLAYHVQTNLDMFKEKMREQGHAFPDDNPLIVPASAIGGLHMGRR